MKIRVRNVAGLLSVLLAFRSVQVLSVSVVVNRASKKDVKPLVGPSGSPSHSRRTERNNKDLGEPNNLPSPPPERLAEQLSSGCDFGGRKLRVAVSQQPPLVSCLQNLYGDWLCNGSNIEVISLLEERLNFQAEWVVLTTSQLLSTPTSKRDFNLHGPHFGRAFLRGESERGARLKQVSGELEEQEREEEEIVQLRARMTASRLESLAMNHTGVLAMVASGRAWLSANGVLKTPARRANLLLSEPFDSFKFHFLLSKSVREHDHIFIKPFSPQTWLSILLSALLIVPIFYLLNSTSAYYLQREDPFLRRISLLACLRYRLKQALCALFCWPCNCWSRRKLRRFKRDWKMEKKVNLGREKTTGDNSEQRQSTTKRKVHPHDTEGDERGSESNSLSAFSSTSISTSTSTSTSSSSSSSSDLSFDAQVDRMLALSSSRSFKARGSLSPSERRELVVQELRLKRQMRRQWDLKRRQARRRGKLARKSGFFRIAYCAWYVLGSLGNQGGEEEDLPRANSTRILIAFWWLYQIVIFSFHSGSLTAILTFPKQSDFIQTLEDFLALELSEKAALRLWLDRSSELAELLAHPDNLKSSPLSALLNESASGLYPIKRVDFQRHRQRVLDQVQAGHSAYLEERSAINLLITQEYFDQQQRKSCLFKASKYPIGVEPMSLVLSDRFEPQCIRAINQMLARVLQSGLAQKWRRKYDAPGNDCLNSVVINAGDVEKIRLKHVMLAFWVLASGLVAGIVLLILEVVWLFTADLDDDSDSDSDTDTGTDQDEESSDEYEQSSSASNAVRKTRPFRLGHRTGERTRPLRSLALDKKGSPAGSSSFSERGDDAGKRSRENKRRVGSSTPSSKERRRIKQNADKKGKRLRRTLELMKRLQEGKIYSEFFLKASGNVQNRARRASQAIVNNLPLARFTFSNRSDAESDAAATANRTTNEEPTSEHPRGEQQPTGPIRSGQIKRSKVGPSTN